MVRKEKAEENVSTDTRGKMQSFCVCVVMTLMLKINYGNYSVAINLS